MREEGGMREGAAAVAHPGDIQQWSCYGNVWVVSPVAEGKHPGHAINSAALGHAIHHGL